MKLWLSIALVISLGFVGCCSAPTTNYAPETAFIATVISQNSGQTLVRLDNGQTLELAGLSKLNSGQRLYIQGSLVGNTVTLSNYNLL